MTLQKYAFLFASISFCFSAEAEDIPVSAPVVRILAKNVGQGNGAVLKHQKNGNCMIIDAGYSQLPVNGTSKGIAKSIVDFIMSPSNFEETEKFTFTKLTLIISHPDKDHLNLFRQIFEVNADLLQKTDTCYLGGKFEEYFDTDTNLAFLAEVAFATFNQSGASLVSLSHAIGKDDFRTIFAKPVQEARALSADERGHLEKLAYPFAMHVAVPEFSDTTVKAEFLCINAGHEETLVLNPDGQNTLKGIPAEKTGGKSGGDSNTNSAVVRIGIAGKNFIFPGDATGKTTEKIIRNIETPGLLTASFLLASHHGAENEDCNNAEWAMATTPETVVFSAGKHGGNRHPKLSAVFHYIFSAEAVRETKTHPLSFYGGFGAKALSFLAKNPYFCDIGSTVHDPMTGITTMQTKKLMYSTHSSGDITVCVNPDGNTQLPGTEIG